MNEARKDKADNIKAIGALGISKKVVMSLYDFRLIPYKKSWIPIDINIMPISKLTIMLCNFDKLDFKL